MRFPVNYIGITKKFSSSHTAIDLGWNSKYGGKNQPIYACDDGVVIYNKTQTGGGKVLNIRHDNGLVTEYAHLDTVLVKKNQKVTKGQQIATMGCSGKNCAGFHLHFGVYKGTSIPYSGNWKKNYVDPLKYCNVYDDQVVAGSTAKSYKLYATKTVIAKDGLNVRTKSNTSGKIVKTMPYGSEIESYGRTINGWNIVDNVRGYYCSNSYLKED